MLNIPKQLIHSVFSVAAVRHNERPIPIRTKSEIMGIVERNIIFSVGDDNSFGAISVRSSRNGRNPGAELFVYRDGTVHASPQSLSGAIGGLPRGKYYAIPIDSFSPRRHWNHYDKSREKTAELVERELEYMNQTFGAEIKKRAAKGLEHIKSIYWDVNPRWAGEVRGCGQTLEGFISCGINRNTIKEWLIHEGRYDGGWGSYYANNSNFIDVINKPNGHALFAKFVFSKIGSGRSVLSL